MADDSFATQIGGREVTVRVRPTLDWSGFLADPPPWAQHLHVHLERIERRIMAEQDDINALAASIVADNAAISSSLADLEAKVGQVLTPADLSGLQAAVAGLDSTASSAPQPPPPPLVP